MITSFLATGLFAFKGVRYGRLLAFAQTTTIQLTLISFVTYPRSSTIRGSHSQVDSPDALSSWTHDHHFAFTPGSPATEQTSSLYYGVNPTAQHRQTLSLSIAECPRRRPWGQWSKVGSISVFQSSVSSQLSRPLLFSSGSGHADTVATWVYVLLSGTGYHIYDLPKKSITSQLVAIRWNFAVQMMYHPLMGLIRASIIMFLFRMKDTRRRIRYPIHAVFWLNIFYSIGATIANLFQCTPASYAWSRPAMDKVGPNGEVIPGGTCIDTRTFVLTSCAFSIFMDLIIIPIPSIMVWNLQMHRRTKILVVGVMSLGWIATGVSVGRFIVYYYRFAPTNKDRTWNIGIAISIAEPAVHIMTACAPATKCLFRYLFPQYGTGRFTSYYEDRTATTNRPGKFGSRGSRVFNFRLSDNQGENENIMELGGAPKTDPLPRETASESGYDLKGKESFDSKDIHESSGEATSGKRTRSKTACTEVSEAEEAEPKHCLGRAR
ncbi:hypothetical protein PTNB73_02594 [Pyrenophora teres f. teres]|uniref:Rhodopsin domain-containing protein n=1 Tax=Pyrenophora teres f. teres TaxID=97479 RepID=A0A776AJ54_9PLEO|nr:hypothetical protein HRS9122_09766 [Pyrenophora teres f. teres]CAA9961681.1 hypothetical protein PTMSG1_05058 [Pyrenophora teres f. maculata]KAE8839392.1 hypothetical protein HRS9139_03775 [Pyrenophora teres f. teres]KAE8845357.1 hypothetical protein PTNB85_03622 [Pyrenophora teres f. teres]KAE8865495.1 hypothetical protein PTNB29_02642 [Pyrenophora teres f. teres]